MRHGLRTGILLWLLVASWGCLAETPPEPVRIAVIIDDMGYRKEAGEQALALPGALTYAFLPQTPYAWQQATRAHELVITSYSIHYTKLYECSITSRSSS